VACWEGNRRKDRRGEKGKPSEIRKSKDKKIKKLGEE